ncbi:MAG: 9-O-acetylesterase [Saprospiraceae bacterium]|nr:9-O-acetylesterase [Saprospiraceae bacterium]
MKRILLLPFFFIAFVKMANADVALPKLFTDHVVLQRDVAVPVWGWASPGETVSVGITGQSHKTKAGKDGKWQLRLQPHAAGGPFEMTVQGKNSIVLKDVLFGDVWLCGGQSNMQWTLDMMHHKELDTARTNNPNIRMFTVAIDLDYLPKKDVKGGHWELATVGSIGHFSAVSYFFGRYLQESLGVPIGLISSNLGATSIETWMSAGALKQFPQFKEVLDVDLASGKNFEQLNADLTAYRKKWDGDFYFKNDPGIAQNWQDPATDISDWKTMEIPNLWEDAGLPDYDGSVWFRKEFDLPEDFKNDTFNIALNQLDDYDIAWVNGVKIGESFGSRNWRNYFFPASILKPKGNVLVVRIFDIGGKGGMYSNAFWGNAILNGTWRYKPGVKIDAKHFPRPTVPNGSFFTHPGLLYNGSIAPLQPFAMKGAIWYQGESNVERAEEYSKLLPGMISDWRQHWGQGDFPFLVVQLANHHPEPGQPGESNWAALRESQMAALHLPNTAIAAAIDIGEADDIHPKNKLDVGIRLGLAARKVAYGENIVHSGPVFQSMEKAGDRIRLRFRELGGGLVSKDKYGFLRGFAIAGADQKFHWALAYIEGESVVVFSPEVMQPMAVRYAWADNPGQLDLYNAEGLPALPFRTDDWRISTAGKVFLLEEHGF